MQSIELHIGPRRCGKSLFVEEILSRRTNLLYIATLPDTVENEDIIREHRERRGEGWETFELSFDFDRDIADIALLLERKTPGGFVMLDGIWTWFHFQTEGAVRNLPVAEFTGKLAAVIANSDMHWYLVDVSHDEESKNNERISEIQDNIIQKLDIKKIIDWNYGNI